MCIKIVKRVLIVLLRPLTGRVIRYDMICEKLSQASTNVKINHFPLLEFAFETFSF